MLIRLPKNLDKELDAKILGASLHKFTREFWPLVDPAPFVDGWHIGAISEFLEAISAGQITHGVINIPPRFMKSLNCAVMWPAWEWAGRPSLKYLGASYAESLAIRDAVKMRRLIDSRRYQELWGHKFRWNDDQNAKKRMENTAGGHRISVGRDGATGDGGDRVICDDPVSAKEAASKIILEGANSWWDETMSSRLNDRKTGAKLIVMQRLAQNDLTGHVLAQGGYEHLCLPFEYDPKIVISIPALAALKDPRTQAGQLLWPERYKPEDIPSIKKEIGSYGYAGQYAQTPAPRGGGMLKLAWFRYYGALPDSLDEYLLSWDMAFKDKKENDYVVGQYWGRKGANAYLIRQFRGHWDFPATILQFKAAATACKYARAKLVEDKANGPAVIATLKNTVPGIIEINPEGGKEARAAAVSPFIEAGNVWLPDPGSLPVDWLADFIEEIEGFPRATHDDCVDAMTQALNYMFNTKERPRVVTMDQIKQAGRGQYG